MDGLFSWEKNPFQANLQICYGLIMAEPLRHNYKRYIGHKKDSSLNTKHHHQWKHDDGSMGIVLFIGDWSPRQDRGNGRSLQIPIWVQKSGRQLTMKKIFTLQHNKESKQVQLNKVTKT